ncbi:MAG TPA: polysaccharide biosynthesis tyrosine autokinase [Tepidisphaeraceae bacterium]|nr:polysaccharide biosynthesis tyrosine autokinase [Tepidisphaeraceae bacterium]
MLEKRLRETMLAAAAAGSSDIELGAAAPVSRHAPGIELLEVVWRRQWLVWACFVAFLAGGFLYLSQAIPIYSANAKLFIQKTGPKIIAETLPQQYGNPLSTQSQIIQSTAILSQVVSSPAAKDLLTLRSSDNPVAVIKGSLKVDPDPQGQIINVAMESVSATDAATIANSVVDAFITYVAEQQKSNSADVLKILQTEKQKREGEYTKITSAILEFQRTNGILSLDDNRNDRRASGNIITTRLAELSDLHTQAEVAVLDAKIALQTADSMKANSAQLKRWVESRIATLPAAATSRFDNSVFWKDYQQLVHSLRVVELQYGPAHPNVLRAKATLESLRSELDELDGRAVENYLTYLQTELAALSSREDQLKQALLTQRDLALDLNSKAAELSQLQTDAKRLERLLDVLDNRIKEVDVNGDTGTTTVSILEPARAATSPVSPKRSRVLGTAMALGLMFGIALCVLVDRLDMRIRSIDEVAQALGLPVLGVISHMDRRSSIIQRGQYVKLQPRSDVAESYRTLRTGIHFGVRSNCRTILVSSPMPGDGKSTCASNLAIALAQTDCRVLLIDADCRKPVQHKIFELKDEMGLAAILEGKAAARQAIRTGILDRLDILPCGYLPENPAELLNSEAFKQLLAEMTVQYDKVVIDSPPLIPVTDARILSAACDVTIIVLRADKSTRRGAEHAMTAVSTVGGVVLGAVVNDAPRNRGSKYGYSYGYKGDYAYGHDRRELERNPANGNGHRSRRNGNGDTVATSMATEVEKVND